MNVHRKGVVLKRKTLSQEAEILCKKSNFTKEETEKLLRKFQQVTEHQPKMDRPTFRTILQNIFQMTDDFLMDRIFKAFDKDNDMHINQEEWVRGMHIFLRGSLEEKITFCFEAYDLNSDGYISREEMFHLLNAGSVKQTTDEDPEDGIKDLVDFLLNKLDQDHDHRVSCKDYAETCHHDTLLVESLGPCLPKEPYVAYVENMLAGDDASFDKLAWRA